MSIQDAEDIVRAQTVFAGPCHCGPAVHINFELEPGKIFATCVLTAADCDELIDQIQRSKRLIAALRKH